MRLCLSAILVCCAISAGCGTTNWTDTRRSATEQLLISDAMDRAVSNLDFRAVAGKRAYLDSSPLSGVTDSAYLVSLLRQHMLAEGCLMMEDRKEADYVVEVRAGAVGTDRREVMFGVPAAKIGGAVPLPGVPTDLPEMPLATKTEQRAVAKIAVFAYNRHTGRPVWQSGVVPVESKTKDVWLLGAGPFQRGSIHDGTAFAGEKISIPLIAPGKDDDGKLGEVTVADQAYFAEPPEQLAEDDGELKRDPASPAVAAEIAERQQPSSPVEGVIHAGHTAPSGARCSQSQPKPIRGAEPQLNTPPPLLVVPDPPWSQRQPTAVPASGG
ncbi:MAG: DUF6655 family protein [Planctomycetota bacterium]|jgi:hypothetical protein